jgi:GTP-binding protein Era
VTSAAAAGGFRAGTVAIVGRPSVGKSTLLNRFVGEKLAITSPKAQTTRHRILGVAHRDGAQIAFLDTPGLIKPLHRMNERMMASSRSAIAEADAVLWLVDASERDGPHNRPVADIIRAAGKPVVLALNKIDKVSKAALLPLIAGYRNRLNFAAIVPLSARTGDGVEELCAALEALLPVHPPLYPDDELTDRPTRFFVAEFIREAILRNTGQEVRHAAAVLVRRYDDPREAAPEKAEGAPRGGHVLISADIMVEREGQKAILIGKKGATLKQIGSDARASIERFIDSPAYLELFVKVRKSWREDDRTLDEVLA